MLVSSESVNEIRNSLNTRVIRNLFCFMLIFSYVFVLTCVL